MTTDKEKQIISSLSNKEYREALAVEHVNTTLAIQIRNMREKNTWRQSDFAKRLGKHQETISQWENPDYGRYSITTLKELAAAFDVALLVKFIPFSELVGDMVNLSEIRLSPPNYKDEFSHGVLPVSIASTPKSTPKNVDANNSIYEEVNKIFPGTYTTVDTPTPNGTTKLKESIHA